MLEVRGAVIAIHSYHAFEIIDIRDMGVVHAAFTQHAQNLVAHLVDESYVNRSIDSPTMCIQTNMVCTSAILKTA